MAGRWQAPELLGRQRRQNRSHFEPVAVPASQAEMDEPGDSRRPAPHPYLGRPLITQHDAEDPD